MVIDGFHKQQLPLTECSSLHPVQELLCGVLDARDNRSVLQVVEEHLSLVLVPALEAGQKWGPLPPQQITGFMSSLAAYIQFLRSGSQPPPPLPP